MWFKNRRAKYRKQKREATERCNKIFISIFILFYFAIYLARREALDKSQRTDGESTATGSSTPSAISSSSLSSVGQETTANADHSLSTSHHLVVCPTIPSNNSDTSASDLSLGIQSAHSPNYSQQPLALTTNGRSNNNNNNNNNKSISINNNYRKETFPINHMRQHMISATPTNNNNNNIAPYLKL